MRWALAVAVLAGFGWCQAPPSYFTRLSPTLFRVSLPANGANPESHCYVWARLGGLYDAEVACYAGGVFTGRLDTAPSGAGFDGSYVAPGAGFIRWAVCNAAISGCGKGAVPPAGLTNPMYYELGAGLGDGSPEQFASGYY